MIVPSQSAPPGRTINRPLEQKRISRRTSVCRRLRSLLRVFVALWRALQVSHYGGKFSIERVLALDEYTRNTSMLRVLLVCIGTPLPMAGFVMILELVPLQDYREGWLANYAFWIRTGLIAGLVAPAMVINATYLIEGVAASVCQLGVIFVLVGVVYTAASMAVSALWVFPIPFMMLVMNPIYIMVVFGSFWMVIGTQFFRDMLSHWDQFMRYISFTSAQIFLVILYPVYQVLFDAAANTVYELPVVLLLPIIKLSMKVIVSLTIVHMEDMIPEAVIFTVDFFNAIYLATSMQSASSLTTVVAIIVVDILQTMVAFYGLHRHTTTILARLRNVVGITDSDHNLLSVICTLCRNQEKFKQQDVTEVRIRSCIMHHLSPASVQLLVDLDRTGAERHSNNRLLHSYSTSRIVPAPLLSSQSRSAFIRKMAWVVHRQSSAVQPMRPRSLSLKTARPARISTRSNLHRSSSPRTLEKESVISHRDILAETLEVLFTSECVVLTEYLESVIPVLYSGFILVMMRLPNAQYHMELDGITLDNVGVTVQRLFVYAVLEVMSFAILVAVLQRNCGMPALYHLAFVLETQAALVQIKLVVWVLMMLTFRIVHFGTFDGINLLNVGCMTDCQAPLQLLTGVVVTTVGVDFTFQFPWISDTGH